MCIYIIIYMCLHMYIYICTICIIIHDGRSSILDHHNTKPIRFPGLVERICQATLDFNGFDGLQL